MKHGIAIETSDCSRTAGLHVVRCRLFTNEGATITVDVQTIGVSSSEGIKVVKNVRWENIY